MTTNLRLGTAIVIGVVAVMVTGCAGGAPAQPGAICKRLVDQVNARTSLRLSLSLSGTGDGGQAFTCGAEAQDGTVYARRSHSESVQQPASAAGPSLRRYRLVGTAR